jgi:hypothetical protein
MEERKELSGVRLILKWLIGVCVAVAAISLLLPHLFPPKNAVQMIDRLGVPNAAGVCCIEAPISYFSRTALIVSLGVLLIAFVSLLFIGFRRPKEPR